jgi:hypothetical protein
VTVCAAEWQVARKTKLTTSGERIGSQIRMRISREKFFPKLLSMNAKGDTSHRPGPAINRPIALSRGEIAASD